MSIAAVHNVLQFRAEIQEMYCLPNAFDLKY